MEAPFCVTLELTLGIIVMIGMRATAVRQSRSLTLPANRRRAPCMVLWFMIRPFMTIRVFRAEDKTKNHPRQEKSEEKSQKGVVAAVAFAVLTTTPVCCALAF
jgi:hypothetical protein